MASTVKIDAARLQGEPSGYRSYWTQRGHALGWAFTPLNGKRPIEKGWQSAPRPSLGQVLEWAQRGNVGLRTGRVSGIVVVDLDNTPTTRWAYLPDTPTVLTGRGEGRHLYYRCPELPLGNSVGRLGKSIDTRGDGGQVVFVGSVHPKTGRVYRWAPGLSPDDLDLAPLPSVVVERLIRRPRTAPRTDGPAQDLSDAYVSAAVTSETFAIETAPEGCRNETLNRAAFSLARFVPAGRLTEADLTEALFQAGIAAGLTESEVRATVRSGLSAGVRQQPNHGD